MPNYVEVLRLRIEEIQAALAIGVNSPRQRRAFERDLHRLSKELRVFEAHLWLDVLPDHMWK